MADYTVYRNERKKDTAVHLNSGKVVTFDGATATADLTEGEAAFLHGHGYHCEEASAEEDAGDGE